MVFIALRLKVWLCKFKLKFVFILKAQNCTVYEPGKFSRFNAETAHHTRTLIGEIERWVCIGTMTCTLYYILS